MRSTLEAIAAHLRVEVGVSVGIGDMTGTPAPFVSLWATTRGREDDAGFGSCTAWSKSSGMTVTAETAGLAIDLADAAMEALMPGLRPGSLTLNDRRITVAFISSQNVTIDRQVTLPNSNTHPAYITVQFDIHSQPIKEA